MTAGPSSQLFLTDNILRFIKDEPLKEEFDGHANCFVETGNGKALLIDFNYEVEPLAGKFPFANIGPMSLLKETRLNHLGKMFFRWVYWNMLLPGRDIPFVTTQMTMRGKQMPDLPPMKSPLAEAAAVEESSKVA